MSFHLRILSPERTLIDVHADEVIVPTAQGQLTILPGHANLLTLLVSGEVRYVVNGEMHAPLAVAEGFVEVLLPEKPGAMCEVTILSYVVEKFHNVDLVTAEEALKRAREKLKVLQFGKEYDVLSRQIDREFARVRVARKYGNRLAREFGGHEYSEQDTEK